MAFRKLCQVLGLQAQVLYQSPGTSNSSPLPESWDLKLKSSTGLLGPQTQVLDRSPWTSNSSPLPESRNPMLRRSGGEREGYHVLEPTPFVIIISSDATCAVKPQTSRIQRTYTFPFELKPQLWFFISLLFLSDEDVLRSHLDRCVPIRVLRITVSQQGRLGPYSCKQGADAMHPDCALVFQHMRAQEECSQVLKEEEKNRSTRTGCPTAWDEIHCWRRAEAGRVVSVSCADVSLFANNEGYIYRNCTENGWSNLYPSYEEACMLIEPTPPVIETSYFSNFRQVYTAGYATSLIALISAIFVFTVFRKFHCTRNYIHINLFFSFILRASAVFIKDGVLFADEDLDHCFMSTTSCKSAVAFFQFSILANYFWLLVEGMYLQTLLALTFVFQKKYFWWYILIGWGVPTTIISAWILTRSFYDDRGCWDDTDVAFIWWIIKAPITASLLVNFIIFINVIRILVQKLRSPGVGGNDTSHFKRLAKSTLLLIPLFGMHYMVFAFLPENTGAEARIFIELGLGSFQGFVVALLYCFLNGEVQTELKKRFWKWQTQNYLRYSKRRRTLFTESSTVTQISVLDKSSPNQLTSETHTLTPSNVSAV
ncbi:vasoactive intestinal polypeptide receptor 1 [Antennarius striatus]|uniref:vasoactive intestinal polypeptide receptor 1 n=1 Tax=Antennarius striatus TaxID=241820 RepID=UPI0035B31A9B